MDTQTTTPQTAADRVGTVGHETKQAAGEVAATAGQEAQQVAREAKDQARQLWSQTRSDLTDQASTQQARVADGLRELADQLGQMAGASEQDGMARGLVDDVARRAGGAATWLEQRDPGSLLGEARSFARQRPGTFLAIAAGLGVLAGRLSRGLVDEARDSSDSSGSSGSVGTASATSSFGDTGYATTTGGYGTASLGATGSNGGTGMPTATNPTTSTTTTTPITPGASTGTLAEGAATVPSGDLPGPHRTSQPLQPDGTPSRIDLQGNLTAEGDGAQGGER